MAIRTLISMSKIKVCFCEMYCTLVCLCLISMEFNLFEQIIKWLGHHCDTDCQMLFNKSQSKCCTGVRPNK